MTIRPTTSRRRPRRGYTLIEILIVVVLMGIAGALVIPSFGSTHILRVQASARAIVADITAAQSDAVARQERRAIVFDGTTNSYSIFRVRGETLTADDLIKRTVLRETAERGLVGRLAESNFNGTNVLVFDELGGPLQGLASSQPLTVMGTVRVSGYGSVLEVRVEPYTGRVSVARIGE